MTIAANDEELIQALRERVRIAPREPIGSAGEPRFHPPSSRESIVRAEAQLRHPLPSLLRRIYEEVADGGFGPGYGLFPLGGSGAGDHERTLVGERDGLAIDPRWPDRLVPLCDWGCAIWSCLDCRSDDGPVITLDGEKPYTNTGNTLRTWLAAWLADDDLWAAMFEGQETMGVNPFTKKPMVIQRRGKARGTRWP